MTGAHATNPDPQPRHPTKADWQALSQRTIAACQQAEALLQPKVAALQAQGFEIDVDFIDFPPRLTLRLYKMPGQQQKRKETQTMISQRVGIQSILQELNDSELTVCGGIAGELATTLGMKCKRSWITQGIVGYHLYYDIGAYMAGQEPTA